MVYKGDGILEIVKSLEMIICNNNRIIKIKIK